MPWEVTIRSAENTALGTPEELRQQITTSVPAFEFYREPSGVEKIEAARASGVAFPQVIRESIERQPASVRAEYEGEGISILLYGFEDPTREINVEIRGMGNPLPVLANICQPNGWVAIEDATGNEIDLSSNDAQDWESFQKYRDLAIRQFVCTDHEEPA